MLNLVSRIKLAIAVLCLSAQSLAVGHHVLVEHTRCEEHGEMVHADHDAHHVDHVAEHAASDATHDVLSNAEGEAHVDDHDHCIANSDRRKALLLVPALLEAAAVAVLDDVAPPALHTPRFASVYWVAPKTSPPV